MRLLAEAIQVVQAPAQARQEVLCEVPLLAEEGLRSEEECFGGEELQGLLLPLAREGRLMEQPLSALAWIVATEEYEAHPHPLRCLMNPRVLFWSSRLLHFLLYTRSLPSDSDR